MAVTATDTHRAIDAVWRIEAPRLIAGLTRIVRDVGLAQDPAQDALVAALVLGLLVWLGLYLREDRLKALIPIRKL